MWKRLVLWLFVINLGVAFGAGIYESRVVVPQWAEIPPAQWPNTGLLFWVYVTTVPLTLLTVFNGFAAYRSQSRGRTWHLAAVGVIVIERLATFSYFIPAMVGLMGAEAATTDVRAALSHWQLMNQARHLLTLTGWLLALNALGCSHAINRRRQQGGQAACRDRRGYSRASGRRTTNVAPRPSPSLSAATVPPWP